MGQAGVGGRLGEGQAGSGRAPHLEDISFQEEEASGAGRVKGDLGLAGRGPRRAMHRDTQVPGGRAVGTQHGHLPSTCSLWGERGTEREGLSLG